MTNTINADFNATVNYISNTVVPRLKELGYCGFEETLVVALGKAFDIHGFNIPQHTLDFLIKSHSITKEEQAEWMEN
jgi:hypothetical protein